MPLATLLLYGKKKSGVYDNTGVGGWGGNPGTKAHPFLLVNGNDKLINGLSISLIENINPHH